MSALVIATIVFSCAFGGAVLGMILNYALPEHQLDDSSKDVVRVGMGLVATTAALVLGLLIASAKSSYDTQKSGLEQISANIIVLDGMLAQYGPEAQEVRDLLRRTVGLALERIWAQDDSQTSTLADPGTTTGGRTIHTKLLKLSPQTDMQRILQSQALQISANIMQARWLLVSQQDTSPIPMPLMAILVFWLAVLFTSFGLFAPPNATVIATQVLCAIAVSQAIFLIMELAEPLTGLIQVSSAPLRDAYAQLGQ